MREVQAMVSEEIHLGRRGENLATCVTFDVSEWQGAGEGTVHLLHQRNGDEYPYPCAITVENGVATWIITAADVEFAGRGKAELQYLDGEVCIKSEVFATKTLRALGKAGEAPPEPEENWVNQVLEAGGSALESSEYAQQSAREAEESAAAAQAAQKDAEAHMNTAAGHVDDAQQAAQEAAAAAETAAQEAVGQVDSMMQGYVQDAQAAEAGAAEAKEIAEAAKEGAQAAQEAAEEAAQGAVAEAEGKLQSYVEDAQAAKEAAEKARDEAQEAAGGDFASFAYVDDKAAAAETNANQYTDQKIAAIPTPDVSGQIGTHNADTSAHAGVLLPLSGGKMTGALEVPAVGTNGYLPYTVDGSNYGETPSWPVGYLKIKLPKSAGLIRFRVSLWLYYGGCVDYYIAGRPNNPWAQCHAFCINDNLPVKFGYDTNGDACVYIGTPTMSWAHPRVWVNDVHVGSPQGTYSVWKEGWACTFSKEEPARIDATFENTSLLNGITPASIGAPTVGEMNAAIASIPTPDVSGQINSHNSNTSAHSDIRTAVSNAASAAAAAQSAADSKAPMYTYGTVDLTAGSSPLESGKLYFVYE